MGQLDSLQYASEYSRLFIKRNADFFKFNPSKAFYEEFYLSQAPIIPFGRGVRHDYKVTFSKVISSTALSAKEKDHLVSYLLERIATDTPSELSSYYDKYAMEIKDSLIVNKLNKSFQLILNPSLVTSDIELENLNGELVSLKGLLKRYRGKPVYVDFWASWCKPCIAEIPSSIKLKEKYNGAIEFIYISMDDDIVKWEKAINKTGLSSSSNNFVVLNKSTANFIKEHKIYEIPRYFLYDKEGEIISSKAPRPSDLNLRTKLDNLLIEAL